jgi:hypothetical protein
MRECAPRGGHGGRRGKPGSLCGDRRDLVTDRRATVMTEVARRQIFLAARWTDDGFRGHSCPRSESCIGGEMAKVIHFSRGELPLQ